MKISTVTTVLKEMLDLLVESACLGFAVWAGWIPETMQSAREPVSRPKPPSKACIDGLSNFCRKEAA